MSDSRAASTCRTSSMDFMLLASSRRPGICAITSRSMSSSDLGICIHGTTLHSGSARNVALQVTQPRIICCHFTCNRVRASQCVNSYIGQDREKTKKKSNQVALTSVRRKLRKRSCDARDVWRCGPRDCTRLPRPLRWANQPSNLSSGHSSNLTFAGFVRTLDRRTNIRE